MNQQNISQAPKIDGTDQAAANYREANQALVQRFYDEVINRKNLNALREPFVANIVTHKLDYGAHGGDLPGLLTGLPDVQATVSLWAIEHELVTAVVTFSGTHRGKLLGIASTGKAVTYSIIDVWRVKDGKLVELWHNVPNCDILAQISSQPA